MGKTLLLCLNEYIPQEDDETMKSQVITLASLETVFPDDGGRDSLWNIGHQLYIDTIVHQEDSLNIITMMKMNKI